jgi:hypothetical protein
MLVIRANAIAFLSMSILLEISNRRRSRRLEEGPEKGPENSTLNQGPSLIFTNSICDGEL